MLAALGGIRVLEWSTYLQGPVAGSILGSLGADVIKIEQREAGDHSRYTTKFRGLPIGLPNGTNSLFEEQNLGKKGIAIDLKKPEGQEVIYRLVEKSDVFLHNFRKGVAERVGMDYKTLSGYNSKLIYAWASGYGPKGPDSQLPTLDPVAQARTGIMFEMGPPDAPPFWPISGIGDESGATHLALAIVTALLARERLGIGQEVYTSVLGSTIRQLRCSMGSVLMHGRAYPRVDRTQVVNPMFNYYKCKDDRWIVLGLYQPDRYWHDFCQALNKEELERDPKFENSAKREENCAELIAVLDAVFATRTYDDWREALGKKQDLIFGPVNTLEDVLRDPQVIENDYIVDFDHPSLGTIKVVGLPIQFGETPWSIQLPAPGLGEHTTEVLSEIAGYSEAEINDLVKREVI